MNLLCGRLAIAASIGVGVCGAGALGGPIDPPTGPVESTMKTLDEVEPRISINSVNTPGDDEAAFVIDRPGSYYLTQNFTILGTLNFPDPIVPRDGIRIESSNVTIDLNGFSLVGGSGADAGILTELGAEFTNITIRNGTVTGFDGSGIRIQENIASAGEAVGAGLIENVHATHNGGNGISGLGLTIVNCQGNDNGFDGLGGNIVINSNAERNGAIGIEGRVVTGCTASDNENGIVVTLGRVEGSSAFRNLEDGISASGSVIKDCSAWNNAGDGYSATRSVVRDSVARGNDDAGFRLLDDSTIDRCLSSDNGTGYFAQGSKNRFSGNTATGNTTNWFITGGNICRVIAVTTSFSINGDAGGSPIEHGPWDNFTQ